MHGLALLLLTPLLTRVASGGDQRTPHICAAQWPRATASCAWEEPVVVKASGRSEDAARRHAVSRLREALDSLAQAAIIDANGLLSSRQLEELSSCGRVPSDEVMLACMPSPSLAEAGYCYVELPADPCWSASLDTYEGVGWQAAEQARHGACEAVTADIAQRFEDPAEQLRCQARCQARVAVRCLSG